MAIFSGWPCGASEADDTSDPQTRLCRAQDQVRSELEARDRLYLLVAYKYLHTIGLRIAMIDSDIRRELAA